MKLKLFVIIFLMTSGFVFSQGKSYWTQQSPSKNYSVKEHLQELNPQQLFTVNLEAVSQELANAPKRSDIGRSNGLTIGFPSADGKIEFFNVYEASTMHPDLQARFPNIRSYVGQGITNPAAVIRFSVSPKGIHTMLKEPNKPMTFIEPYATDLSMYVVYTRDELSSRDRDFECEVTASMQDSDYNGYALRNADDSLLRTYRLAVSTTGEYTQYHGGTKALALAAINTTMTRVNGVFENDFNVTLQLIANNDLVIYTNPSTDPYTTTGSYNNQLQSTLTNVIGEANYDVGHLFANAQNNGNAGCIGCVCVDGQKGRGWTSRTTPEGDPFDIDYVAHELGHQFGANHTWTFNGNEGTGAQMEPGSGSTIMGYAGITGVNTDVQSNSDPYFHAISIQQVTNYIKNRTCQTNTNTGNAVPVVDAGPNYTIPRATPFVLDGTATDADPQDVLTYCWEQFDQNAAATTLPSPNNTSGVAFRSYNPTVDSKRYFPRLETVKTGATSWKWEAVPNVNRNLNFRLTVRDNRPGSATNKSDDMIVAVTTSAGPFVLTSPNTNILWTVGSIQNVTWNVAGTTGNGVNAAAVDIFLSTDGGDTYPIALATGVPNNGSASVVVPNNIGTQNRVMVKGSNHIFFDISNSNFTIEGQVDCNASIPQGVVASNIGSASATINWTAIPGATYDLQFRVVGSSTWNTVENIVGISTELSGLQQQTQYEVQVRSKCPNGNVSNYSSSLFFTTTEVQLNYCASQSSNVNDEYIGNVQLNTINNSSGAQFYSDFTNILTTLTKGDNYNISITAVWTGTVYNEGYAVWIDYNKDGDFDDAGEQVFTRTATNQSPVSGNFAVPEAAVEGTTRMRVSMKYNAVPTACESFTWGEVEDYTVIIEGSGPDVEAPIIVLNGSSTINLELGENYTELGATATDNVDGNLTSSIIIGGDIVNPNVVGNYIITYNVSDSSGNQAVEVTRTVVVNPDITPPVITLSGPSNITLNVGDIYQEQGATATDNFDGDISANIVISGTVNTSLAGVYLITYNVSDSFGNAANEVVRTVNVVADTVPPVITLIGSTTINLLVGDTYSELGATAQDNLDGDITSNIVIAGSVNTSIANTYFITYNVTDNAGNQANEVIRTVIVSEPSNGCSGGIVNYPYTESFENSIGAWTQSTLDDLDWLINSGGTPSSGTGPSTAAEGNDYIYVEASGLNTGYPNKSAIITSPCFDLSSLQNPVFSFQYHMYGATDMGSLGVEISNDGGNTWVLLWSQTGNQGNQWLTVNSDLSAYAGSNVLIRFNRLVGSTWQADVAIDAINLFEPIQPTCSDGIQNGDETGVDCGGSLCEPCTSSNVIITQGFFETGWDGWIDGGGDCARVQSANSFEGLFSIQIRDNSGVASSMSFINVDVTSFSSIEVDFYFYVFSMENGEDFWLRFFDGSQWITAATWVAGSNIQNNNFYNATVTLNRAQYNFAVNSGFRFQCDASANQDQIFIDQVTITGISGTVRGKSDKLEVVGYQPSEILTEDDFEIYPNPVKGSILNVFVPNIDQFEFRVMDLLGKVILNGKSTGAINVGNLEAGVYIIEVNDGDELITQKFIKS